MVAITSSRINRGRFATKTLIFSTPTPLNQYLRAHGKEQVQFKRWNLVPGPDRKVLGCSGIFEQGTSKWPQSTKTVLCLKLLFTELLLLEFRISESDW